MSPNSDGERLSVAQRACLLKAARIQLQHYTEDLEHLMASKGPDADIAAATREIACVQGAIRWLWKDQKANDP